MQYLSIIWYPGSSSSSKSIHCSTSSSSHSSQLSFFSILSFQKYLLLYYYLDYHFQDIPLNTKLFPTHFSRYALLHCSYNVGRVFQINLFMISYQAFFSLLFFFQK
ncbi:unnamed protein product [Acanthoscelides obtectus]|uniref:Uncharacterized protein n=1 Tax=Acanthoscelides obtectus TaxID=200917 RepID=A0A9P0P001_ACAOB|nr:unnamed protein product [Acanthoscelides obtectus]CAK1654202.1 hypothetical protein AOBTE_LOCUS18476 [Acanthoscelides obtectus]